MDHLAVYLHLARASAQRRRPQVRDRLLVLAAVQAAREGLLRVAAYCRHRILQNNPLHTMGRWPTVSDALRDPEFTHFLRHLERRYPPERAERLLYSLGIELAQERASYYSDEEYAAALLGTTVEELKQRYGSS